MVCLTLLIYAFLLLLFAAVWVAGGITGNEVAAQCGRVLTIMMAAVIVLVIALAEWTSRMEQEEVRVGMTRRQAEAILSWYRSVVRDVWGSDISDIEAAFNRQDYGYVLDQYLEDKAAG